MADSRNPRREQGQQQRNGQNPYSFPILEVARARDEQSQFAQAQAERLAAAIRDSEKYTLGISRYGVESNANTPFGFQNPSAAAVAYARHLQESQTERKSPYTAKGKGKGGNAWMGAPAVLTADDDPKQPETVDKVLETRQWDLTELIDPQAILNDDEGCGECCGVDRFPDPFSSDRKDEAHEPDASNYNGAELDRRLPLQGRGPRPKPMHARVERLRKE